MKLFFFPNLLKTNFKDDKERSEYIINQLTKPNNLLKQSINLIKTF